MSFNVINVVSNVSKVNLGVWKAAIVGCSTLLQKDVKCYLLVCQDKPNLPNEFEAPGLAVTFLGNGRLSRRNLKKWVKDQSLQPETSVVVTHGSWLMPTKLGHWLKQQGFSWVYVPQGMLEPWSRRQGRLKKMIYFRMVEKQLVKKADAIRAVSKSEKLNLSALLKSEIYLIENGISVPPFLRKSDAQPTQFVFMARLHYKKGIVPLVKQWASVMKGSNVRLKIAGPDEGELEKIGPYLKGNIEYIGPVYGYEKERLLRNSHYYCLPSYSEGFPSSVLEAMSYGMIPLISKGCNFPEVFDEELGYRLEPDDESIQQQLTMLSNKPFDHVKSEKGHVFVERFYSESAIGEKLFILYKDLVSKKHPNILQR